MNDKNKLGKSIQLKNENLVESEIINNNENKISENNIVETIKINIEPICSKASNNEEKKDSNDKISKNHDEEIRSILYEQKKSQMNSPQKKNIKFLI